MSFKDHMREIAAAVSVTAAFAIAGCATAPQADPAGIPAVHPRLKPRSCIAYENEARRLRPNRTNQGIGDIIGGGVGAIFGNTRQAERAIQRGATNMGRGTGEMADRSARLEAMRATCERDVDALYAPGGICATFSSNRAGAPMQDGRQVGPARGGMSMAQECASARPNVGPDILTPQSQQAPSQAPAAPAAPGGECIMRGGRAYCPQ